MTKEDKKFCKAFVNCLDFDLACLAMGRLPKPMRKRFMDKDSDIREYINELFEVQKVCSKLIDDGIIRYHLGRVTVQGENTHKIQAAKVLLDLENNEDGSEAFKKLLGALKK